MKRSVVRPGLAGLVLLAALLVAAVPLAAQAPLTVGAKHPVDIDSARSSAFEILQTSSGRVYQITHPGATYMAVHFSSFDLPPGDRLIVSDADGRQGYELTGRGKMQAGEFWAQHVKGDTVVLELQSAFSGRRSGFTIDEYAAGFVPIGPGDESVCGTDDKDNAICYAGSNPSEYGEARAVARLLIQGSSLCTGWLASANNHLVTNEHCISSATAALNTDYEFDAEAANCNDTNCQLCHPGVIFSGATFIQDNPALDYALVQITSGNPAATYGFLEIDDRTAVVGEQIYIPQHPGGRAKELGIASSHSADAGAGVCQVNSITENGCSSGAYNDVGYYCDTEGGSSGSPVLATSSHKVIALHHCRGSIACTQTGGDENRGVPITLVCDEICPIIQTGCTVDADCDDRDPCTADTCSAGACSNDPIANCCGNGTCELGEDCDSCAADCISGTSSGASCGNGICEAGDGENCVTCAADCNGKQNGKPSGRFCCGDGGGESPVSCTDSRCTQGSFQCTDVPQPGGTYCCGDNICEGDENCSSCGVDCNTGAEVCDDGVDNDCNGAVDCDDAACATDPSCQAVDCSGFTSKQSCNGATGCRWDNRNKVCVAQ